MFFYGDSWRWGKIYKKFRIYQNSGNLKPQCELKPYSPHLTSAEKQVCGAKSLLYNNNLKIYRR